jgi:mannose-6-phosphate isomerase-like protein (cupin superfamily)
MEIRKLDRAGMPEEYGVSVQRLVPWDALNAPFEGAWCVVAPGQATDAHSHHEYEIFIAISGEGALEAEGERSPFLPGDIVHFPPGVHHQVINAGDTDFQFYSVFWDSAMAGSFAARDAAAGQEHHPPAS